MMPGSSVSDLSPDLNTIDDISIVVGLTPDEQQLLAQIFDEYLQRVELGESPTLTDLVEQAPELAEPIGRFFDSLRVLHRASTNMSESTVGEEPELTPVVGMRLGDFDLLSELGRGGMAVVYRAAQRSLERTVALKVLPLWTGTNATQIARFRNEAQALAQLQHPNIVPVYSIGEESGVHYFAMQLIEGRSLGSVVNAITRRRRQDAEAAAAETDTAILHCAFDAGLARYRWIAETGACVARALHAAHEYGIVHRDVKPSNLLLNSDGKPFVADFGLARINVASDLTNSGDIVGTARYMSPEQARGQLVDHRTDVYSLGITLYELVTGKPAYGFGQGPNLLARIANDDPPRPGSVVPDIPPDLENIIMKAVSRSRDDRYATAADFAADLERFVAGKPVVARWPGLLERTARWLRRNRGAAASLAAVLVVLTAASAISTVLIYREKLITDAALSESDRNYRQAREVVDRFGAQLAEELSLLPGAQEIRHSLLLDTISYYRRFVEQSGHGDEVETELATALNKIALLTEQIGADADAMAAHREALRAFEQLAQREPDVAAHRASLALCENNVALLLQRAGQLDEASQRFRRAITIQQSLRTEHPESPQFARDLGLSLNNLGLLLSGQGSIDEARDAYRAAIALQEQEAGALGDDDRPLRYLAATYSNLAALLADQEPVAAQQSYAEAMRMQTTLADRNPHRFDYQRDLALTMNNLAALHSHSGNQAAAEALYHDAVQIHRRLLESFPGSVTAHRDLAVSENNQGLAAARAGKPDDAEAAFRRAIDSLQPLTDLSSASTDDSGSLGSIWNNLALVLQDQSQITPALTAYGHAVELLKQAVHREPETARFREALGRSYINILRVQSRTDNMSEAVSAASKARSLSRGNASKLLTIAEELACLAERRRTMLTAPAGTPSRSAILRTVAGILTEAEAAGLDPSIARSQPNLSGLFNDAEFLRLTQL